MQLERLLATLTMDNRYHALSRIPEESHFRTHGDAKARRPSADPEPRFRSEIMLPSWPGPEAYDVTTVDLRPVGEERGDLQAVHVAQDESGVPRAFNSIYLHGEGTGRGF